ncbi:MAG: cellulase family glycosylhydrolase [Bacteroidales bacterium]|nr:cellulase family glycosylhydrolase [Bacteroidales bacterium]
MKINTMILTALLLAATACGNGSGNELARSEAPVFLSSVPADGAVDVEYQAKLDIVLTYDQNIKCPTSGQNLISVDNGAGIEKVNAFKTNLTITLTNLNGKTRYTVDVPSGAVLGFKENQYPAEQVSVSFTTKETILPPPDDDTIPEPEDNDAWRMLDKLALGWNMGNHFDAFFNYPGAGERFLWPDETCWGNAKCTRQTFTKLRAAGFKSIRIPITWLNTIGEAPGYTIDKTWMDRIVEVVGWARDAGLNVIINSHHDEDHYYGNESMGHRWLNIIDATANEKTNELVKDKIKGFWTNVAETFKNEGDYLIFESFNEINDGRWGGSANTDKQAAVLNQWNQVFVDAIRATGGNNETRWLGVPTYAANPGLIKYFKMPQDPAGKMMLAVHCYDPYNYTLAEGLPQKYWGHTTNNSQDEKLVRDVFSSLYVNYIAKGIPVYMGEFGCSMRDYSKKKDWNNYLYYLEYFVKCSKSYGLPCFLWDNGSRGSGSEHHAYLDHGTGEYIDHSEEAVKVMNKAMYTTDKSYTLKSVYDNAPR